MDFEPQTFVVERSNDRWRDVVLFALSTIKQIALAGYDFQITLGTIKRTLDQNRAMWPALTDFANQVPLVVTLRDGSERQGKPKDWKAVLTAAFEDEIAWAPSLDGAGMVMVGASTSAYSKRKMGEFLTFVRAEGEMRGVRWSAKAESRFEEFCALRRAA